MNVLIPQGHISLIKSDSKYNYDVTKYVFWMFYSSKNPENIYVSKKNAVFNIDDNKKCFLSRKISRIRMILKGHVTGVIMQKIPLSIQE